MLYLLEYGQYQVPGAIENEEVATAETANERSDVEVEEVRVERTDSDFEL